MPESKFNALCRAMAAPGWYDPPVETVEQRETHISKVFLTGKWAYKLKKPVDFGFLDFRKLEDRRYFCEREVSLNQRLSQDVYEGVVAIHEEAVGRFSFAGRGPVVEYAVKMKQLPDHASLRELLRQGALGSAQMEALGQRLAAFYQASGRSPEIDHYGSPDVVSENMEENFRQVKPIAEGFLDAERWEFLCQVSRSYLAHHRDLFNRRIAAGRIRDGHGDLRTDHIYLLDGQFQIIDCIEFNDRFRYGDVVSDLAFLHMDLEDQGRYENSVDLLSAYAVVAQDPELFGLIDFYACYRATVKLKTTGFRYLEVKGGEKEAYKGKAKRYLELAYRYALQFGRPTLWIMCGLPASGKSSLAAALSSRLSIDLLQSDLIRKSELPSLHDHIAPYGQGVYRTARRHQVYVKLLALAEEILAKGHSVILDATFSRRKWRHEARLVAEDRDANLVVVECTASETTIRERLQLREKIVGISDARLEHLKQIREDFEPMVELPPSMHFKADCDQPFQKTLVSLLAEAYKCTREQVIGLLSR